MLDSTAVRHGHEPPAGAIDHARRPLEQPTGPILKNWFRVWTWIEGNIYNDPLRRWPDGTYIHTSHVRWINEEVGLAQTMHTLYLLRDKRR
jgi:hypothetical protein